MLAKLPISIGVKTSYDRQLSDGKPKNYAKIKTRKHTESMKNCCYADGKTENSA
jgi:hypothetical protein